MEKHLRSSPFQDYRWGKETTLAKMTLNMPKLTKTMPATEIGLMIYPDALLSAVYGLSDLFMVANQMAMNHEGVTAPPIRVSHWQAPEDAPDAIACVRDTLPGTPNKPVVLIAPPSLGLPLAPEKAAPFAAWLKARYAEGATACSVCAGSFLLGEAGILQGRSSTTHWFYADSMAQRFPGTVVEQDKLMIDDGDIITAGGFMAWTDLGLRLVNRICGPTVMMETARFMLVDPPGREQRFYASFAPRLHHGDQAILKVQHWLQANGARDVSLKNMAAQAGLEERTFLRRFHRATGLKPTEYCQHLRVGKARERLEFSHDSIEQIAWEAGYEDAGAFRKVFHKIMGLTPAAYRDRFNIVQLAAA